MDSNHNEAVISGIAGRFPECHSVEELKEKLFDKTNLLKPDLTRKLPMSESKVLNSGKISDWNRFDNAFFGVPPTLVRNADPMMGLMLEATFEAILDAGLNPYSLKGRRIGVFAAPSLSDSEVLRCDEGVFFEGAGMVGNSRAMMANRISYCFNFTGPSYSTESSWVSAVHCLDRAVSMVSSGIVEGAIVATANVMLYPSIDLEYRNLGLLADDCLCQPFDADGHGFVRSDSVVAFFIQRRKDAKRVYGGVRKAQVKCMGAKDCSYVRLDPLIETFFRNFYKNTSESPGDVSYIEAHGTCHKEIDASELNAVASVFCSQKKTPLLIGSITGNAGHSDSCTGLVAIVKAILAMETGVIPPTLNYNKPNPDVPALATGQLKPVTEKTELPGDLVGVNVLNCYGSVGHVLLRRHNKVKRTQAPKELPEDGLPRLVLLQARHAEGIKAVCEKITSMAVDVEFVSLVNDAFRTPIPNYLWRGYSVVPTIEDKASENYQDINSTKRPLWFLFSGMGSQWTGMGKDLMNMRIFASSIEKCDKVLRPKGLDIVHILSSNDESIFDNILHSFVGITAIQIGLVDVLRKLNITPDGIIGHSVGELGCAYADGCFTAEETILAAYARGKASIDSLDNAYIRGMMAAVGLGYNDIKDKLPPTIDVACHNSKESSTLSGPADDVNKFVEKLKSDGVFAKAVSAGGIAYHSRYIKAIAPKLLKSLKEILPDPKPRSSKWISTSVPESQWNTDEARLCSPEYHTNNLLNPVYFEEGLKKLPKNAILVEIAPHGLLQAILRRAVSSETLNLSMTSRSVGSNLGQLLKCIGELYINNVDVDINALYPTVEYPVSRGTPSLQTLASWDHELEQYSELHSIISMHYNRGNTEKVSNIHPTNPDHKLWVDHRIAGQVVLPLGQILMYPWEMILNSKRLQIEQFYTIIEDVTIRGSVPVDDLERVLVTSFSPSTLRFEVSHHYKTDKESTTNILSGRLVHSPDKPSAIVVPEPLEDPSNMEEASESEIYLMLSELGCDLGPQLQVFKKLLIGKKECIARVQWNGNLITFLDSFIKVVVIFKSHEKGILLQPNSFIRLTVDAPFLTNLPTGTELEVHYQSWCNRVVCQGAELLGVTLKPATHCKTSTLLWSEFKFQPFLDDKIEVEEFLSWSVETAAEDGFRSWRETPCPVNILVIRTDDDSSSQYTQMMKTKFKSRPNIEVKISQVEVENVEEQLSQFGHQSVIVVGEYSSLAFLVRRCGEGLYCITYLSNNGTPKYDQTLRPILVHQAESGKLALLKKVNVQGKVQVCKLQSSDWLNDLRQFVEGDKSDYPIIAVTQKLTPRQVLPVLCKELYAHRIRTVFIQDRDAPQFSLTSSFYSSQLSLGLSVNILSGGAWGSLRTVSFDASPCNFNLDNLITSSNQNLVINCVSLNTTTFTFHCEPSTKEPELKYVDYSGVQKGQRVMGVAYFETEANSLCPDSVLRWPVPADWTMEDAATVPVLYSLAYYCVNLKAKVEEGEFMLVHAGMSPLGQAIISVALQMGAKVLASVMDEEEALILSEQLPSLKRAQVFILDKEDINVAVRKRTEGKGVKVIINCLRGNYFQSTLKITDTDCRILHLAEIRIEDREIIGLFSFFGNASAYGISLNNIGSCSYEWKTDLRKALTDGINQGVVRPLRKKLFRLRELTDALRNFQQNNSTEKTVLISKYEDQIMPLNGYFQCNFENLHIIAGENVDLKFELVEWLIHHGARKLVVLNDDESKGIHHMKRINRILYRYKCSTIISPSSHLDTVESALKFLKETLHIGMVSSIFCVCMDENSNKIKNLDAASRELLPRLQQFVSLFGSGTGVCDSRASSGLPACSIQSESFLETGARVLPYLSSLLADTQTKAKFYFVSDSLSTTKTQDETDSLSFLPNSIEELYALGGCVASSPCFTEEVTRSPGSSLVKHCLLPVFVIPGLGRHSLKPLLRQIIHPAFCCNLPAEAHSIEKLAQCLVQDILKIQTRGHFNILGESWGGALALAVGSLLEAHGHQVNLILIQGIPTVAQNRLKALCRKYDAELGTCLLDVAVKSQAKDARHLSWRERLAQLLPTLEPDVQERVANGVTTLNNQLSSLLEFKPSAKQYKGSIILIRNKTDLLQDLEALSKCCQQMPKVVTVEEANHTQLIASSTTATAINDNIGFDWRP